mmetsp:Transcript_97076/g.145466  ORF Transcript_97076/g.145466 Transcript_97076/m.145466 type:complete len:81 (+) Transcript_97076:1-243(+)
MIPAKLEKKLFPVALGGCHSLFQNEDGIYGCGWNCNSQSGVDSEFENEKGFVLQATPVVEPISVFLFSSPAKSARNVPSQ